MRKRITLIILAAIVVIGIVVGVLVLVTESGELTVSDNPFGGLDGGLAGEGALPEMNSGAGTEFAPRLIRITDRPVSEGAVAITRVSTTTVAAEPQVPPVATSTSTSSPQAPAAPVQNVVTDTEIRFIDRTSGNIYRFVAHERSLTRLSNKTLPGIQRASWLSDGSAAYVQFLSNEGGDEYVASYLLPDDGEGGFFLEQNLRSAKAMGANSFFTLLAGTTGSVGSVANADGTNTRTVFTSLISSLVVHPTNGNFFAHTKASSQLNGYAFQINAANGNFSRLLGPLPGLTVLPSPDGTKLLYTYLERGTLRLAVFDVASQVATALPVATLTEKCTWAANSASVYCGVPTNLSGGLPDRWYQGVAVFSDRLWRLDMTSRLATLVVDPSAVADVSIDAVALTVDPAEDVLVFTDKHNGSLWMYDL